MGNKNGEKRVIVIPPKPEMVEKFFHPKYQRVAAYCRVSRDTEEQLNSYEVQKAHYTEKIMTNPDWTMVGIFADEGISGTKAKKRPEFMRLMNLCKQDKVDLILTKSVSRFARNTEDCLYYVRMLKEHNVTVIFEKENINTRNESSEFLLTLMGAFAQAESESMSANIKWGRRRAIEQGHVGDYYTRTYGYRKTADGKGEIDPERALVVQRIYSYYLDGMSVTEIKKVLDADENAKPKDGKEWSIGGIQYMLRNEAYCGDVLTYKTYIADCISKRVVKNKGQHEQYLIKNHHPVIIPHDVFEMVKKEINRRANLRARSNKTAITGMGKYSGKYALTGVLLCGECGSEYKRCTWVQRGVKRVVWRCTNRLDYGKQYCTSSPTIDEEPLQTAIIEALNSLNFDRQAAFDANYEMQKAKLESERAESTVGITLEELDELMKNLDKEATELMKTVDKDDFNNTSAEFFAVLARMDDVKKKRDEVVAQMEKDEDFRLKMEALKRNSINFSESIQQWSELAIRRYVDAVRVLSKDMIQVYTKTGEVVAWQLGELKVKPWKKGSYKKRAKKVKVEQEVCQ